MRGLGTLPVKAAEFGAALLAQEIQDAQSQMHVTPRPAKSSHSAVPLQGQDADHGSVSFYLIFFFQPVPLMETSQPFNQMAWLVISFSFKGSSCNHEGQPGATQAGDPLSTARGLRVKRASF